MKKRNRQRDFKGNCRRRLISLILAAFMVLCICPGAYAAKGEGNANTNNKINMYDKDWRYWSQGASQYPEMRREGCYLVAQAKMLVEMGIASGSVNTFNPDIYYKWCNTMEGNGNNPVKYAKKLGKSISTNGPIYFASNANIDQRCSEVMKHINNGEYVILGRNREGEKNSHFAYVSRAASLSEKTPVIYDSWADWSYTTNTTIKYKSYSYVNFDFFRVYKVSGTTVNNGNNGTNGPVDPTPSWTVKNPSSLTANSVQLNASCSYRTKPTEVGVYVGTSTSSLAKKGSDKISHNQNPFDIWYKITGLKANTKYYYEFYAVVGGKTFCSSVYSFTTNKDAAPAAPSWTIKNPSGLADTSVQLNASCSYRTKPAEVGVYVGTSTGSLAKKGSDRITHNKNPFDVWYKITGLKAGTTYYYRFYAIVNGQTSYSGIKSFTTSNPAPALTVKNPSSLAARSVQLNASCSYKVKPTEVGVYMGTSANNLVKKDSDKINHNKNPFDMWYKISGLKANTKYYYRFYGIVNGRAYWSSTASFTTKAR